MMSEGLSPYLIALALGWAIAHLSKLIIDLVRGKRVNVLREFFISGGMPSSHASTSVAVWSVVLWRDGIESALFGLATLFMLIVCYDAVKVRRSVGEQGKAIIQLIKATGKKVDIPRAALGHTPLQVLVGAALGFVIGTIVFFATR